MRHFTYAALLALATMLAGACHRGEDEREACLDFLYRFMPLPDSTDYSREFYEQNVEAALTARREMPWGSSVPEREFRHFVLPVRVNNEHLDSSRTVFYRELKPRVESLSMEEAILEVNHWCHEHATYRPSDARTSSPLATVSTAYGRCGEESTLLVAALRSVGIPARQVYTPRWAHTDDNHAWVEAWADGQWHFLGACEPEPVLDLGWFNESASRGMLMHTKVFGDYDGPEEVMSRTPCYTEINVTDHYAPTSQLTVTVTDSLGHALAGVRVDFKLYNYAEFYTVATKVTDADGHASLTAGRGDMLLWACKDGLTAFRQVTFGKDENVSLTLSSQPLSPKSPLLTLDITPPPVSASLPLVSDEQRQENNRRLAREDSIRQAREATMPVEAWRGHHEVIQQFLDEAHDQQRAQRLLSVLSAKDLRDVEPDALRDSYASEAVADWLSDAQRSDVYDRYVLCPRVENEWLTPYKAYLRQQLGAIGTPQELVRWCKDSLTLDSDHNPQQLRMQPMSVYRHRTTDELGRSIFFVAAARSLGFPARINEVDGRTQYYDRDGQWHDACFNRQEAANGTAKPTVSLRLHYLPAARFDNPKYYIHFTLSRLGDDGWPQLLTFPEEATWRSHFANGADLEPGNYVLTTGTRMASGKVLASMQRFTLRADTTISFTLRETKEDVQVIGSQNAENHYFDLKEQTEKTQLSTTGRGYYVLALVAPNQEPTNHALRDIAAYSDDFERWGRKLVVLLPDADDARRFNFGEFSQLPATVVWGTDINGKIAREVCQELRLSSTSLPVFLICDTFNRVVFCQQGYTIGMGEQLLKVISQL